jgi:hypothetical protein
MGFSQSLKDRIAWVLSHPISPYVAPASTASAPPDIASAKTETEPATPRKRGRPRAVKLANDDLSGASAVKKPRGRPKRARLSAAPAVAVPLPNGKPPENEGLPRPPRVLSRGATYQLFTTEEETLTISRQIDAAQAAQPGKPPPLPDAEPA